LATSVVLSNVEINPGSKFTKGRPLPKQMPGVITKKSHFCVKMLPINQIQSSTRLKYQSFTFFSSVHSTNRWFT